MTKTRVLAALVMGPVAIGAVLLLPTGWLMLLAALLFLVAQWEWLKLVGIEDTLARTVLLTCNLGLMVALTWGSRSTHVTALPLFQITIMVGVVWWLLALLWLRHYDFCADNGSRSRIFKLIAGTAAVVPAWCALAVIHHQPNGSRWLLLALLLIWAADSGAYFAGRRFGSTWFNGRKLAPRISPNKTLAGVAGGIALALLVAIIGALLIGAKAAQLPAIAVVATLTVVFSIAGDLFESLLKRHANVKDSGTLIPGHGGALDRLDSVLAALPVFALGKVWLGF